MLETNREDCPAELMTKNFFKKEKAVKSFEDIVFRFKNNQNLKIVYEDSANTDDEKAVILKLSSGILVSIVFEPLIVEE